MSMISPPFAPGSDNAALPRNNSLGQKFEYFVPGAGDCKFVLVKTEDHATNGALVSGDAVWLNGTLFNVTKTMPTPGTNASAQKAFGVAVGTTSRNAFTLVQVSGYCAVVTLVASVTTAIGDVLSGSPTVSMKQVIAATATVAAILEAAGACAVCLTAATGTSVKAHLFCAGA